MIYNMLIYKHRLYIDNICIIISIRWAPASLGPGPAAWRQALCSTRLWSYESACAGGGSGAGAGGSIGGVCSSAASEATRSGAVAIRGDRPLRFRSSCQKGTWGRASCRDLDGVGAVCAGPRLEVGQRSTRSTDRRSRCHRRLQRAALWSAFVDREARRRRGSASLQGRDFCTRGSGGEERKVSGRELVRRSGRIRPSWRSFRVVLLFL